MEQKYIVGDLVIYTSLLKEPVAEICEVRETSYLIRFMNGNFAKVTSKEIKPIPLTKEILEKNGWKRVDDEPVDFEIEYFGTEFSNGVNIFYNVSSDIYRYGKHTIMIYLHELQHLLYGLGLNSEMEV